MQPKTYFIIGANGVGKSTLLPLLKDLLSGSLFALHDFDERGVPDNADKLWRLSETAYWFEVAGENKTKGISTIICGFVKPVEVGDMADIILLDVNASSLEDRLNGRYQTAESVDELKRMTGKTVEKFIADNVWVASVLRKECCEKGYFVVDTSNLAPQEVARRVCDILKALTD